MNELNSLIQQMKVYDSKFRELYRLTHKRKYSRTTKKIHIRTRLPIPDKRYNKTPEKMLIRILIKHPLWGARRVHKALLEKGYKISLTTVYRRLRKYGLQRTRRNDVMLLRKALLHNDKNVNTVEEMLEEYFSDV